MKALQYFLITIISLFLFNCKKPVQESEKIDTIQFSYHSGLRIPYNEVTIYMERNNEEAIVQVHSKPLNDDVKWKYSKIDTLLFIDIRTFNKLAKSVISLDKIDINKAYILGLDGYSCKIEYGEKGKNKSYSFWSPTSETKKRGLTEFVNLSEQILDISGLKKKEIIE
jgi:hypothetical protein